MNLYEQIEAIAGARGKDKLVLMESYKDDQILKDFLYRVYEPTISYYLKPVKGAAAGLSEDGTPDFQTGMVFGAAATIKELRGNAARTHYTNSVDAMDAKHKKLLDMLLNRDVKAGIAASSINKIWPGLITDIPYMRCATPQVAKPEKWGWGQGSFHAYSQLKADGMYANIQPSAEVGTDITSRNGSRFPAGKWSEKIREELLSVDAKYPTPMVYNGELVVYKDGVALPRPVSNGIMNSLLDDGEWTGQDDMEVRYLIWDAVPVLGFVAGLRYTVTYKTRFAELYANISTDLKVVELIETLVVTSYEEAAKHFLAMIKAGKEGTVLKNCEAIWMDGDSTMQVKMKIEFEVDLVITGLNPGDPNGKHAKTFGSLQCETSDGELAVGVSGMTDAFRKKIADNPQDFIGKVCRVIANDVMITEGKKASLFLPRLDEVRNDKTVADTFQRVLASLVAAKLGQKLVEEDNAENHA